MKEGEGSSVAFPRKNSASRLLAVRLYTVSLLPEVV